MTAGPLMIRPLQAEPDVSIEVPGSKSHTNRALICAALAEGTSTLSGVLFAKDTEAMMRSLVDIGLHVQTDPVRSVAVVEGGVDALASGPIQLDFSQSGTTSRFMMALSTIGPGPYLLDGDEQLRARPFGPLSQALGSLGAAIEGDRLPLSVTGGGLHCGRVEVAGSISSQFLSGLLLAAPYATPVEGGATEVEIVVTDELVSKPYVDLTLATMAEFGVEVEVYEHRRFVVRPQRYQPRSMAIEPDASAASYFFAAAAITGGRVRIDGLGRNTIQGDIGFVHILEEMGATVSQGDDWTEVAGSGRPLQGVDVDMADLSDTAQTLAVVAAFASSPTRVRGIDFIKNKEIDRVSAVIDELNALGVRADRSDGGFTVHPGTPRPGRVTTSDDHRMAMSFALLGLVHPGIEIDDPSCVAKTFPDFFAALDRLR